MRSTVSKFAAIVTLTLCTAACGGDSKPAATKGEESMKWLSIGLGCEELERINNDKEAKENGGLVFCGNAGHTFTGELRCERDFIEVQCR